MQREHVPCKSEFQSPHWQRQPVAPAIMQLAQRQLPPSCWELQFLHHQREWTPGVLAASHWTPHSSQAITSTLLRKLQGAHLHLGRGPAGAWHRRQASLSFQLVIWQVSHSHSGSAASGYTPAASQAEFSSWAIHRTGMTVA